MLTKIALQLLFAAVAILAPILYTWLSALAPGIPIQEAQFIQFIVWIVSAILAGSAAGALSETALNEIVAERKTKQQKILAYFIPAGLIILLFVVAATLII